MALNVKNLNTIKNVAKKSDEKSQILSLKIIDNENLIDYPRNNEDVTQTEDIQIAIRENGFSDPIEVTDYGMEPDKYMIVSGHRRRCAGVKEGMTKFPCIIRHFENEQNIYNYVLMSNSHRDSAKDPLLYCKRYKMHEEYLKESGFKGSIINEVAKRIGISPQQAERYNRFNKIIAPCWDLVRLEEVGMSSLLPMATLTQEEQMEVYEVIVQCIQNGIEPTRTKCKEIIEQIKTGEKKVDIVEKKDEVKAEVETNQQTYEEDNNNEGQNVELDSVAPVENLEELDNENEEDTLSENPELKYRKGEKLTKSMANCITTLGKGYYSFRDDREREGFIELSSDMLEKLANELYDFTSDENKDLSKKCLQELKRNRDTLINLCNVLEKE